MTVQFLRHRSHTACLREVRDQLGRTPLRCRESRHVCCSECLQEWREVATRSSVLVRNQTAHLESRLASESSPATACAQSARKPLRRLVTVLLGGSFVGHSVLLFFVNRLNPCSFPISRKDACSQRQIKDVTGTTVPLAHVHSFSGCGGSPHQHQVPSMFVALTGVQRLHRSSEQ